MNLKGNTVLITGGATGIGRALAEAFLAGGNEVIICARRESRLSEMKAKHPEIHCRVCDVTDENDRKALFAFVQENFKGLNILVNNAGIQRDIDLTKGEEDLLSGEDEIAVNFKAPVYLSALFAPFLAGKENAAIVNVSSALGILPMALFPVYCATKAGLHAFTMCLRSQLSDAGVRVFEVLPPAVESELNPAGRAKRAATGGTRMPMIKAEEFAAIVTEGLEKDEFEIFSPSQQRLKTAKAELEAIFDRMNGRGRP